MRRHRIERRHAFVSVIAALGAVLAVVATVATGAATDSWPMSGQDVTNWRFQPSEGISPQNVGSLKVAWATNLGGDISATPAIVDGVAYVPDWGGNLNAVDTRTGAIIWQASVGALAGAVGQLGAVAGAVDIVPGPVVSRTNPAVSGNAVVIGTQAMRSATAGDGAQLLAVDKRDGHLLWRTKLDDHPLSIDSQSATIYKGVIYVGVASIEENGINCEASTNACTFRGSEQAIRLSDGARLWKTYTISQQQSQAGYSGAAVWGSSPAIDVQRKSVYVTTGNNYGAPQAVSDCVAGASTPQAIFDCETNLGVGNYVDSIMSLDMATGAIKWVSKLQGFDAWTTACIGLPTACPSPYGPDYDFGQGAMLIPSKGGDLVVAGQKSGIMWALRADSGAVVWKTLVGPGSSLGGLEWGSATDGKRVYFAVANFNPFSPVGHYAMINPPPGTPAFSDAGSWGAIDVETGAVIWQTADPNGSIDLGPVSVSNGVVYAGSMGALFFPGDLPTMFAFDAASGKTLWSYTAGGSVNAGPAIAEGKVIWGSGYSHLGFGGANNKLYAFSKNGK